MTTKTEHQRVAYGEAALSMYDEYRLGNQDCVMDTEDGRATFSDDRQSVATDLFTDLRHYCDAAGVDFHAACDMSYQHYLAERKGE